jgi:hypothetical protein
MDELGPRNREAVRTVVGMIMAALRQDLEGYEALEEPYRVSSLPQANRRADLSRLRPVERESLKPLGTLLGTPSLRTMPYRPGRTGTDEDQTQGLAWRFAVTEGPPRTPRDHPGDFFSLFTY